VQKVQYVIYHNINITTWKKNPPWIRLNMQNQKHQSWHHQIQMLKYSRVEWLPQTGKKMNMNVSLPGGWKDTLPISFPIWKWIITGIPIWMRWRTLGSFVNILAPKCKPVPRMNASTSPRTKLICSIIVCHIYNIYLVKDEYFI